MTDERERLPTDIGHVEASDCGPPQSDQSSERGDVVSWQLSAVSRRRSAVLGRRDGMADQSDVTWPCESIKKGLTLLSDPVSRAFFKDEPKLVERIIRLVKDDDSIDIVEMNQQVVITNPNGHSVQLDIIARDANGKIYNIEFQSKREKALERRASFYASMLLVNEFKSGAQYKDCPEICVIFLLEHGEGCNGKLVERVVPVDTAGNSSNWPIEFYFVSGALHDNSELGTMMQDFTCCDLTEIRDPVFKARATIILNQKIGRKIMCEAEEKWANELFSDGLIEGRIEGRREGRREGYREGIVDLTKRVMKILGKTLEDTMAYLQLTDEEKQSVRCCLAT